MSHSSSYFDRRHTGGAVASSGMNYQDSCATLIIMQYLENTNFSSVGFEASNDITLCIGASQKHFQTKDQKLTPSLLKSILEGAALDRQDISIMVSSTNDEVDSLLSKLAAYRSHQAHASIGGPHHVAIEQDFDRELSLAGLLELKDVLLNSTVQVQPSHGLKSLVEAALTQWARARGAFIRETFCLHELHGIFSHARSKRAFLARDELMAVLSRHLIEPAALSALISPARSQLDSPESFRAHLRRHGDVAARFEQKLVLAEGYESQRDLRAALKIYQALAVVLHDSEWLLIRCAALSELLDDLSQAEDYARQALKLNSKAFGALCVLGTTAGEKHQFDDALGYFRAAERLNNEDARLLYNIGYTLLRIGDTVSALEYFKKAVATPDAPAASHLNAGIVLYSIGKYREAEEALESALQLEPNMPEAVSQLGELYRFFGHHDAAIPMFNRALQSLPDNIVAKHGLALIMLEREDAEGARLLVAYLADHLNQLPVGKATLVLDLGWHRIYPIHIKRIDNHCFEVKSESLSTIVKISDVGAVTL
ncbi:tetratricopeptide repeat protein [Burkholderia gladioli]|uniref:tetratricopeptide repeat protein n=2 Tax=Burkholderia gladioli TaxID=28095 RepID=UPI0016403B0E|nr:tetratricopeptide repeat protein [Burkholderia gladioli]MDN7922172.1 tetratricopeptide repeat protein [Burkholderia gladioli]